MKQAERDAVTAECQVCEGRQCLDSRGRMVHHGYRRPGHGSIEGDCCGVAHLPFPAVDALVTYAARVKAEAAQIAASLAGLPGRTEIAEPRGGRQGRSIIHSRADTPAWQWDGLVASLRYRLEADARWAQDEAVRVERRIAAGQAVVN